MLWPQAWQGQEPRLERQTGSTSSYARRGSALPEALEWRADGVLPLGGLLTSSRYTRSVLGAESAGCVRPGSNSALFRRFTDVWL